MVTGYFERILHNAKFISISCRLQGPLYQKGQGHNLVNLLIDSGKAQCLSKILNVNTWYVNVPLIVAKYYYCFDTFFLVFTSMSVS